MTQKRELEILEEYMRIKVEFYHYREETDNDSITIKEWNIEKAERLEFLETERHKEKLKKQARKYKKELREYKEQFEIIKANIEYIENWLAENNFSKKSK